MKWLSLLLLISSLASCGHYVKTYYEDGRLQEKYKENRQKDKHGRYKLYYENRQLSILRQYVKGKAEGKELVYYSNGKLRKIAYYKEDRYNGDFIYYFPDGGLEQSGKYENDAIVGELKTYYKSGVLKEIVHFQNGEENGQFIYFHPNGKTKATGRLKNGDNFDGLILKYDEEGTLIQKLQCEVGDCIVTWQINPNP